VVWVALTARRWRVVLAVFGAALFAVATFSLAPPTWLHNLQALLEQPRGHPVMPANIVRPFMIDWMLAAIAIWVVSFVIRTTAWAEYRRRSQGAIAIVAPLLAAFLLAPHIGLYAEAKYLLHAKAAVAVALALPLALVTETVLRAVSLRWLLRPVEHLVPFAVALVLIAHVLPKTSGYTMVAETEQTPTIGALVAVARILHQDHHWSMDQILRGLRTPYGATLLTGLRQIVANDEQPTPAAETGGDAFLMMVETGELPAPLPSNWTIVGGSPRAVLVLVFLQSLIDASEFTLCTQAEGDSEPHCEKTTLQSNRERGTFVDGLPPPGWRGTIEAEFGLRPAAAGSSAEIFMPRMRSRCGGRVVASADGAFGIEDGGRLATFTASALGEGAGTLKLQWHMGSPECDVSSSDTVLPFFIDGEAATVRLAETILRRSEGGT